MSGFVERINELAVSLFDNTTNHTSLNFKMSSFFVNKLDKSIIFALQQKE